MLKFFHKILKERKNTYKLFLGSQYYSNTKVEIEATEKDNYSPVTHMNIGVKILRILANHFQEKSQKIIRHDQVGFILETVQCA